MNYTILKPALECVTALQCNTTRTTDLFCDPQNRAIASVMSMLSQTAQFIENSVNGNDHMHNVNLFIACRVQKGNQPTSVDPTFLLWNTVTGSHSRVHTTYHGSGSKEDIGNIDNEPSQPQQPGLSLQPTQPQQPAQTTRPPELGQSSQPPQTQLAEGTEKYAVPVHVASKCLQLLLDGSGFLAHKTLFQNQRYSELGSKILVEVLHKVLDAERRSRLTAENSLSRSSHQGSSKPEEMIYCDLLPDNLRPKDGKSQISFSVPDISISPKGDAIVSEMMKVGLNIRKPDRNKKNQNFAVLCALLHHTGQQGTCAKVLRSYAREGFTQEGCKRRKKYSSSLISNCSGPTRCQRIKTALCSFYIEDGQDAIGKGTVDPFNNSIYGKKIPEGHMIVRFGSLTDVENIKFPSDVSPEKQTEVYLQWLTSLNVWKKEHIERVDLMGEFNKIIGSAILVHDLIPEGAHYSILQRACRNSTTTKNSGTDVSNAIVVCDVILTPSHTRITLPVRYPYMEWYNLPSLKMLQTLHFNGKQPPSILTSTFLQNTKAILWNKNNYKRRNNNSSS